ncbi:hypothetical protein ACE0DR_08855 [Azotobacter sp. CWF10]
MQLQLGQQRRTRAQPQAGTALQTSLVQLESCGPVDQGRGQRVADVQEDLRQSGIHGQCAVGAVLQLQAHGQSLLALQCAGESLARACRIKAALPAPTLRLQAGMQQMRRLQAQRTAQLWGA